MCKTAGSWPTDGRGKHGAATTFRNFDIVFGGPFLAHFLKLHLTPPPRTRRVMCSLRSAYAVHVLVGCRFGACIRCCDRFGADYYTLHYMHAGPGTDGQGTIGEDPGCNRSALPSGFRQRLWRGFPSVAFPQKHDDRE